MEKKTEERKENKTRSEKKEELALKSEAVLKKWNERKMKIYSRIIASKENMKLSQLLKDNGRTGTCNDLFNFVLKYNRCISCSEFSFLTENGEPSEEDITIQNITLKTQKYPRYEEIIPFMQFNNTNLIGKIPNISRFELKRKEYKVISFQKTNGKINTLTHKVILMNIMNNYRIETPLVASYLCDNLVIVTKIQKNKVNTLNREQLLRVLKSLISISGKLIHGRESMECINIYQNKDVLTVEINPCEDSSIDLSSETEHFLLESQNFDPNYTGTFPIDIILTERPKKYNVSFSFPLMERYKKMFILGLRPTEELFNFYKYSCYNIFKGFRLYLWILVLLADKKYSKCFDQDIVEIMFFKNEIPRIKEELQFLHSKDKVTYEDIKNLCFKTQFRMKLDIVQLLDSVIKQELEAS